MNLIETILVFALIPLAIYGLAGVLTLRSKFAGSTRYRPGQSWPYPAQWWSANITDSDSSSVADSMAGLAKSTRSESSTEKSVLAAGGARGNW